MRFGHPGHVDGLRVVRDHPLHELDVRHRIDRARGDDDVVHARMLCLRATRSNAHQRQGAEYDGEGTKRKRSLRGVTLACRFGEGISLPLPRQPHQAASNSVATRNVLRHIRLTGIVVP